MEYNSLPYFDKLRCIDTFTKKCNFLLQRRLNELQKWDNPLSIETKLNNESENGEDTINGSPDTCSMPRRPRRTASKNAGLKIKKNLNMPLKLRRPSSGISLTGARTVASGVRTKVRRNDESDATRLPSAEENSCNESNAIERSKRTKVIKKNNQSEASQLPSAEENNCNASNAIERPKRTKVIKKNNQSEATQLPSADERNYNASSAIEKSIKVIDKMNLVKKRTELFEKMSKDQQEAASNKKTEMNICLPITSMDNVNNNVSSDPFEVASSENYLVESTTTTVSTKVTRTKTRNMSKQMSAIASSSSTTSEVEPVKPRGIKSKSRKELNQANVAKERELAHQKAKEESLEQKAREEVLAQEAKEEAKRAKAEKLNEEILAKKAREQAAAEEKKEAMARKAREEKAAQEKKKMAEEAKRLKEQELVLNKKLALEKKRQETENMLKQKKEAMKKKAEASNKKQELAAKKREELLQASAAKKKKAAETNLNTQHKDGDVKENMRPDQNAKLPVDKPLHPVVKNLKSCTNTTYNMTPPRDERQPEKPKTENDYGIDDAASSDSSDDETNPKKKIPNWAKPDQLQEIVDIQSQLPLKFMQFMMRCQTDPYKTLGYLNRIKRPRTSSAVWDTPMMSLSLMES